MLFTATLILTFSSHRICAGRPTGLRIAGSVLGAKAVWLGRLHTS